MKKYLHSVRGYAIIASAQSKWLCMKINLYLRGRSSAGRAPHWQCGGHRFDPDRLHHIKDLQFGETLPLASLFYFLILADLKI